MGILDVLNTVILVVGITFGLMLVSNTLIKVSNEEYRKNEKFAMELLDKSFDKLSKILVDTYKQIMKLDQGSSSNKIADYTAYKENKE
jgi:hypothetical protein